MDEDRQPLLEVNNLEVVYSRVVRAVQGISLQVPSGRTVAVVGLNGAGKTTTLSAIAGFLTTDEVAITDGRIRLRGDDITSQKPYTISRKGLALVPEQNKIFPRMTTDQNLRLSARVPDGGRFRPDDIYTLFPVLADRRTTVAGYLSGGERQMLALGQALVADPELLMIDELSLGLAPIIVSQLVQVLRKLRSEHDLTMLFVEQNANYALELADYVYVMENGRIVYGGDRQQVARNEDFRELYLAVGLGADRRSYRDVKQYTKKRRWFG